MYPGIWISKNIPFPALHTGYQMAIQPRSPDVSGNMDKHEYPVSRIRALIIQTPDSNQRDIDPLQQAS
jgi:hypothetical protein